MSMEFAISTTLKRYNNHSLSMREHLNIALVCLFSLFAISGFGRTTNILAVIFMLVYLVLNFKKRFYGDGGKSIVCFIIFFAYKLIVGFINMQSEYYYLGTTVLWTLVEFFPIIIAFDFLDSSNPKYRRRLLFWLSILFFGITLYSVFIFFGETIGGRAFVTSSRGQWIGGGYPIAYSCALLASVLLFCLKGKQRGIISFILLLLGIVFCFLHLFYTQSVITLVASVVGVLLVLLFVSRKNNTLSSLRIILSTTFLVYSMLMFFITRQEIGNWLINYGTTVKNQVFSQRIQEIGLFFTNSFTTNHMGVRSLTLTRSFETFLKNPLFGSSYLVGDTFELFETIGIFNHSEILDSLAKYGVVGFAPLFLVFFYQFKIIIKQSGLSFAIPLLGCFLILTFFNPFISAQTCFMLFLYIPLLLKVRTETKNELH